MRETDRVMFTFDRTSVNEWLSYILQRPPKVFKKMKGLFVCQASILLRLRKEENKGENF